MAEDNDGDLKPDDFERLLLFNKNSSYLWLQYADYHLKRADVQSALNVIQRGLDSMIAGNKDLMQERIDLILARLQIVRKFQGAEQLEEAITHALRVFEAPSMLARAICKQLLEQKEIKACGRMFEELFKNKKRRQEVPTFLSYVEYLFAAGL